MSGLAYPVTQLTTSFGKKKVIVITHSLASQTKNRRPYQLTAPSGGAADTQGSPVDSGRT